MRLLAIMLQQPILVVSPYAPKGAIMWIFPATLDGPDERMAFDYQKTTDRGMFIPAIAYEASTIVLYHNGGDHYAITWVPPPADCDAPNQEELLSAFKAVAAARRPNWFVVGGSLGKAAGAGDAGG